MNRRKAIIQITLAGAGILTAAGGYKWYSINKTPDLAFLDTCQPLLDALVETIIPTTTDSPGAKQAGVGPFIAKMIRDCTGKKEQNNFLDGLKDLRDYAAFKYGHLYEHCAEEYQEAVMEHFERKGRSWGGLPGKAKDRYLGRSFFAILKAYTVEGYCTSQAGATKCLAYSYVPGSYQGCINLQPGQKAWATN